MASKRKIAEKRYSEAEENEWVRPVHRKFRLRCCDCHLIHEVDFRVVDGCVEMRFKRHDRATAASRRWFKFSK